jgi:DNA-binding MarR family transcriptional regulator
MKIESRNDSLAWMAENTASGWAFLTNHAQVLVCIAHDPGVRLRDIGERVGITERAAHRIVGELTAAGYITRQKNGRRNNYTITRQQNGRRNNYTINAHFPLPDPVAREQNLGQLLEVLTATHVPERRVDRTGTSG